MRMILASLCLVTFAAAAQTTATAGATLPTEAARIRDAYHAGLAKIAQDYDDALLPGAEDYVLELKKLSSRLKEAKDSAGMEAVRKEAGRFMQALGAEPDPFETVPELTVENLAAGPEALRLIQESYVARRTANDLARNEKVTALAEKYIGGLDALQSRYATDGKTGEAAAAKKEATRLRVAMQRKDFPNRAFDEAGAKYRLMPPQPDIANLKERAAVSQTGTRNLTALTLTDLTPAVQAFLLKPLEYDKDWPPEITKWKFEGSGNYSHDFSLYNQAGQPDELGIFAYPKTLRAYVRGTIKYSTVNFDNKALSWMGKAVSWQLADSRDLVCKVVYRTKKPALKEDGGPAACVAVYSITENNRLIASLSVPMLSEETQVRVAKHYSYNRLNIVWEGSKRKRGFTIPDHMPMRVAVGIVGFAPGEEVDATIEVQPCGQVGDMW
ncbi:MAG TPA: hypothetical protein PKM57_01735 [Kiritimatiellia bacterium]|nr:hypothetical protein [Kiritimatiellia bacterium]HPS09252.1 hypothetical protein [Kiritimatiellia bacterium]